MKRYPVYISVCTHLRAHHVKSQRSCDLTAVTSLANGGRRVPHFCLTAAALISAGHMMSSISAL